MTRTLLLLLLLHAVGGTTAHAQVDQDPQIWTAVLGNAKLGEGSSGPGLWLDTHLRRSGPGTLAILRPAVGWRHEGWLSAWAGYAWVPSFPDEGDATHEHRAWQQLILQRSPETTSLQLRSRFEQRFAGGGGEVGFRLREFARFGWTPTDSAGLGLVVWDELFIGLNETEWGAVSGFDQNRVFVGIAARTGSRHRLEIGYLSLFLNREPRATLGHVLATNLFVSL